MPEPRPDVLVAGAGPVGLTVTHELRRRGIRVRLVDSAACPATTSRALATHARTLETYEQMGILGDILPRGQRVVHFTLHRRGRLLVRFDTNYAALPTRFPFSLMVDQVITEGVLRDAVAGLGVKTEWATALTAIAADADGTTVTLSRARGKGENLWVPWLVGADGGHSTVRSALGLTLHGDRAETWLNADVVLDSDGLAPDSNHLIDTGQGSLLLVPFPDPGKWRVIDTVDVDGAEDWEFIRRRLAGKLISGLGRRVKVGSPSWVSTFTVQQRMIDEMRVGRVLLAGDAAHVHSPASGQGMNTGIQDAYNLGWKLADVIAGRADESLLDTYGAERVPVGQRLLKTTRTATTLVALRKAAAPVMLPVAAAVLNGLPAVKRQAEANIVRGFCGLSLSYRDSPLTQASGNTGGGRILPGDRVGCDAGTAAASAGWRELLAALGDTRWKLLAGGRVPAAVLADAVRGYAGAVWVRPLTDAGDEAGGGQPTPLPDPDGALRAAFGLPADGCALIRPDGYLAGTARLTGAVTLTAFLRGFGLIAQPVLPVEEYASR